MYLLLHVHVHLYIGNYYDRVNESDTIEAVANNSCIYIVNVKKDICIYNASVVGLTWPGFFRILYNSE